MEKKKNLLLPKLQNTTTKYCKLLEQQEGKKKEMQNWNARLEPRENRLERSSYDWQRLSSMKSTS
jgi:hypothetical protein